MKTHSLFYSRSFRKATIFTGIIGLALLFNSCKKDRYVSTPAIAALSVVNASPNSDSVDFYIGYNRVNTSPLSFGEKIDYQRVYQGVRPTAVTAINSQTSLFSKSIAVLGGEYQSLYIVGKVDALDYVFLKDDLSDPAASKAKVRFINLSPDAASLSLEVEGDTTSFLNKAYKDHTQFKNVNAGATSTLTLKNADQTVAATISNVDLKEGKIYTVWAKGLVTTDVDAQKLTIHVTEQPKG